MIVWTEYALRAEVEYRQDQVRRGFLGRRWRRVVEEPAAAPVVAVRIPRQRTAGPGEHQVPKRRASPQDLRRPRC